MAVDKFNYLLFYRKSMVRKTNLYILRLINGKYYVGISQNPQKRIKDHFAGRGAGWTRTHKPVGVEMVLNGVDMVGLLQEWLYSLRLKRHGKRSNKIPRKVDALLVVVQV